MKNFKGITFALISSCSGGIPVLSLYRVSQLPFICLYLLHGNGKEKLPVCVVLQLQNFQRIFLKCFEYFFSSCHVTYVAELK